ncbi:hypothetical protein L2E82_18518 [Cichorium intybus]|uniref:Uncharacterized protein n=1 Tax=Cichorium intybus TaxID=13427 RepID=A0ACB9FBN4_CICIN|nr:hypothetical protein L2E82_18518 [Cichorium intybus]
MERMLLKVLTMKDDRRRGMGLFLEEMVYNLHTETIALHQIIFTRLIWRQYVGGTNTCTPKHLSLSLSLMVRFVSVEQY